MCHASCDKVDMECTASYVADEDSTCNVYHDNMMWRQAQRFLKPNPVPSFACTDNLRNKLALCFLVGVYRNLRMQAGCKRHGKAVPSKR